jgi:hypothetical protein
VAIIVNECKSEPKEAIIEEMINNILPVSPMPESMPVKARNIIPT